MPAAAIVPWMRPARPAPAAPPRAGPRLPPGGVAGQVARGFLMGSADLVPGVSGGTIALALGIYERLVAAVHDAARAAGRLVRLDLRGALAALRRVDWRFLLPLLAGIGAAVVLLAGLLTALLRDHPVVLSAAFGGLVAGSVVVAAGDVRRWDAPRLLVAAGVAALTAVGLGLRALPPGRPPLPALFLAGAVAVCAMILPGISGSFVLLLLGTYEHVLAAVHARDVPPLVVLAAGAAVGLALFAATLDRLLREYHDTVLAALIGLMAGSLRVLWPWPAAGGVGDSRLGAPVASDVPGAVVAAALAAVAMVAVAGLARGRGAAGGAG